MTLIETTEVVSMISDMMNLSLAFMTLYLSAVTGYLIVAYLPASNLTRFQAGILGCLKFMWDVRRKKSDQ